MIPDKLTYKTTITKQLRDDIRKLSLSLQHRSYLEIGCDRGYTMATLADCFDSMTGIDIDHTKVMACQEQLSHIKLQYTPKIIVGTSDDLKNMQDWWDIVLIDADHSYDSVKHDYENVLLSNQAPTFCVFFHDYGLVGAGVKHFVDETFGEFTKVGMTKDWNPHGSPTIDWEAVYVRSDSCSKFCVTSP